ncbi:MAG: YceI family protein [Gammaproteobacteria bacterium]|nr:YceI family protein [Gammaproteobacteria bacterium]
MIISPLHVPPARTRSVRAPSRGALSSLLLTLCLLLLAGAPIRGARAQMVEHVLDPDHLVVAFMVEHIGYARVLGLFREAAGRFRYDERSGEIADVVVTVQTNSIFTNHAERDKHLLGKDFFNTSSHPQMVFRMASARPQAGANPPARYRLQGELELLGVRRPLTLEATVNKAGRYPFSTGLLTGKPYVLGVSARGRFKRSDFGMRYGVDNGLVGDEVEIMLEFEAVRQ